MARRRRLWEITVRNRVDLKLQGRIKRLLMPVLSVHLPGKCYLCGTETTWTVNEKHVCPACSVLYGFVSRSKIPGPCEVCDRQGEWCTDEESPHSLCYTHRDMWFKWDNPTLNWREDWAQFVTFAKAKLLERLEDRTRA